MDNDMSLTGGRMHPRSLGQFGPIVFWPVGHSGFYPERRPASNAAVERYNGLWQEGLAAVSIRTLLQLQEHSRAFQEAYNAYLRRRLIRQGKGARLETCVRSLRSASVFDTAAALSWTDLVHTEP